MKQIRHRKVLHDLIYIWNLKKVNIEQNGCSEWGGGKNWEMLVKGYKPVMQDE